MENKTTRQTILETLKGADNEGSAKRITSAYFTVVLITAMVLGYLFGFFVAVLAASPTPIHTLVVNMYEYIIGSLLLTLTVILGLTNVDRLIDAFKWLRGYREDKKSEETKNEEQK